MLCETDFDPTKYDLSLRNLQGHLYNGELSGSEFGFSPVFSHVNNKFDPEKMLTEKDYDFIIGDETRFLNDVNYNETLIHVFSENDKRTANISNLTFLFVHTGGWLPIWEIRTHAYPSRDTNDIMRRSGDCYTKFEEDLVRALSRTQGQSIERSVFFLLVKRNHRILETATADFNALHQLLKNYIEWAPQVNRKEWAARAIGFVSACCNTYDTSGNKLYLTQGLVALFLASALGKYLSDTCLPRDLIRTYNIQKDANSDDEAIRMLLEMKPTHINRPVVTNRLQDLLHSDTGPRIVSIYGVGGIGKTTSALEYASINANRYRKMYYLPVSDVPSEEISLDFLLKEHYRERDVDYSSWDEHTLVVVDNLNEKNCPKLLYDLAFCTGQARIIITSREPNLMEEDEVSCQLDLDHIEEDKDQLCYAVFQRNYEQHELRISKQEKPYVSKIIDALGHNLMLITIVASSLREYRKHFPNTSYSITYFADSLDTIGLNPFKSTVPIKFEKEGISRTDAPEWFLTELLKRDLVRIHMEQEEYALASWSLSVLLNLPSREMDSALLCSVMGDTPNEHRIRDIIDRLASCSWINVNSLYGTISVHPVVAHVLAMDIPRARMQVRKLSEHSAFLDHLMDNCMTLPNEQFPIPVIIPFVHQLLRWQSTVTDSKLLSGCYYYYHFRTFFGSEADEWVYPNLQARFSDGILYVIHYLHGIQILFMRTDGSYSIVFDRKERGSFGRYYGIPDSSILSGDNPAIRARALRAVSRHSLNSVAIPEHIHNVPLNEIAPFCFYGCKIRKRGAVRIPSSVRVIGESAFRDCSGKWSVIFDGDRLDHLGPYCFHHSGISGTLALPESLKSIPSHAFDECGSIQHLLLPSDLQTVGMCAFANDTGLSETLLKLPPTLKHIGSYAFYHCGFGEVQSDSNHPSLGTHCFSGSVTEYTADSPSCSIDSPTNGVCDKKHASNRRLNEAIVQYVSGLNGEFPLSYHSGGIKRATQSMSLVQHIISRIWKYDLYEKSFKKRSMNTPGSVDLYAFLNQPEPRFPRAGDFIWFQADTGEKWNLLLNDFDADGIWLTGGVQVGSKGIVHFNCTKLLYSDAEMYPYFHRSKWLLYFMPTNPTEL